MSKVRRKGAEKFLYAHQRTWLFHLRLMALHNPSCEGCESKKYKILGKARAYMRVSKDCRLIPKKMVCKQRTEN